MPSELIAHHINAIQAIVRERTKLDTLTTASELSRQLRDVSDEYLTHANRDPSTSKQSWRRASHQETEGKSLSKSVPHSPARR